MTYFDRNWLRFGFSMRKWEADWIPPRQHSTEGDKVTQLAALLSLTVSLFVAQPLYLSLGLLGHTLRGTPPTVRNDKIHDIWQFYMLSSWWCPTKKKKRALFQHITPSGSFYIDCYHCLTFDADLQWNGDTSRGFQMLGNSMRNRNEFSVDLNSECFP